jgi:hypothetical protein
VLLMLGAAPDPLTGALVAPAWLHGLICEHVQVPGAAGANPVTKVLVLFAGMILGADSIHDMGVLRHGAMGWLLNAVPTPSTLGTSLRSFTFGHVRKIDPVATRFLVKLTGQVPLLAGADQVAFLDIDDTIKAIYGYQGEGDGYGYSRGKGLNALFAIISTP